MTRRIGLSLLFLLCLGSTILSGYWIHQKRSDLANFGLTFAILIIGALTFLNTLPKKAKIEVTHLDELETDDLIFYIHPNPNPANEPQVPRQYLLQLHVAVSNVGDRKAILSAIRLEGFCSNTGETIHLPGAKEIIEGERWQQQSGWINGQSHFQNISIQPPYILDRDEAVVIRFRTQRGISWGNTWSLDRLRTFVQPLENPIVSAFGTVIWRRAGKIVCEPFKVEMKVNQQEDYVRLVKELTTDFTVLPDVLEAAINIE